MQASRSRERLRFGPQFAAVAAGLAAICLIGGSAAYLAKSSSAAGVATHSAAQGAGVAGSAWNDSDRRSGTQTIGGQDLASPPSPKFHEPGSRAGGNRT